MMKYEIDPMSAASPDMDDAEFAALKQSIAEIGQLVSIVAFDGRIIDGRKRLRACQELGKEPSIIELAPGADLARHAIALNLFRTQYTASQRAMYAAKLATGTHGGDKQVPTLVHAPPTILAAAKAAGVARGMVIDAKAIRRDAIPEVVAAVERGDLTIHSARQVAEKPKHDQLSALTKTMEMPKGRDGRRIAAPALGDGRRPKMHRRSAAQLAEKAMGLIDYTAQELANALDGVEDIADPARWLKALDGAASTLRRAREILRRRVNQ